MLEGVMRTVIAVGLFIGLIAVGVACSTAPAVLPTPSVEAVYKTITLDEFAAALDQPDAYTVINVHIPYEGEVPNTDGQIAYNNIDALTAALLDRNAPIILYCRSGRMSEEASRALVALGYTNVVDVPGGMNAWTDSGRDLLMSESGS
jgi:rhodanese-related sulfurtransferase